MEMIAGFPLRENACGAAARTAVNTLKSLLAEDLMSVNAVILDRVGSTVKTIPELAGHLINSGGKRLRPMLTLASARMFGFQGDSHVRLGAAVEFIHTATLLHDDVVDGSAVRRGSETANLLWGNQASVLVGDFLFSRAFELMVEVGDLRVLQILSRASSVIVEGELLQLQTQKNLSTTLDDYLRVIDAKTAALFAAAAQSGAIVAGHDTSAGETMFSFGRKLGIAFQLVDDALDYSGHQDELGKTIGDDFREGKMTMPLVIAVARSGDSESKFWARTIKGEQTPDDLDRAIMIIRDTGAIDETLALARRYSDDAKDLLAEFPDSKYRSALLDLSDFAVTRAY